MSVAQCGYCDVCFDPELAREIGGAITCLCPQPYWGGSQGKTLLVVAQYCNNMWPIFRSQSGRKYQEYVRFVILMYKVIITYV